ncbi:hypothetical protein [Sphingomonas fennica]|uniref:Uncharacterized protein n=1 Tax=Edaphosphingomonas fennica TaxID=114404 RepID=A0A2T4HXA0_9SPHN|nr:hypothetical protein [Sphingomonas fennica]PTD20435.1 hypothetical protein CV103_11395 [Sphingomonas fennica]
MSLFPTLASPPPISLPLLYLLADLGRREMEELVELAIDLLNLADGDLDIEANGDELDFNGAEDDFGDGLAFGSGEPGCPISDPGGDSLDYGELDAAEGAVIAEYGIDQRCIPMH